LAGWRRLARQDHAGSGALAGGTEAGRLGAIAADRLHHRSLALLAQGLPFSRSRFTLMGCKQIAVRTLQDF
jgi:hypothetical protein